MFNLNSFFTCFLLLLSTINAERKLYSNSLVNCMKNNTDIVPNYFNVTFDAETRAVNYDISITARINAKLKAYATIYAFGFDIIHETIDLCDLNLKQFCPITASEMEVESVEYISEKYVNKIPGIAYTFPDLDAVARLVITNDDNQILGCLQASFNNGKTVSHEGAKWATAVVAGIGLLTSAVLSLFGNSASASRMSAAALSLFTYFQSVVIIAMISVEEVSPIANSWAENLAWSMGLIRINFMQEVFRWYIQATGGTPTQYLTFGIKSILTQRSIDKITNNSIFKSFSNYFYSNFNSIIPNSLLKRSTDQDTRYFIPMNQVESNDYLLVLRGIDRIGYDSNIEPTSIVSTGFTFFILCLYVLVGVYIIYRYLSKVLTKGERKNFISKNLEYRKNWQPTIKGMLLRYIYIGFPQLLILSLWEFTQVDSGAVVTIAVLFFILSISSMTFSCFQVIRYGKLSIKQHGNPAALLYGNPDILSRYGFLYTMLNAKKFWFCSITLSYLFIKGLFVGLSQSSGKTQAMAIWILDMFYLGLMCHFLPYLDRFTNILSVFIQVITTINSFFFTFFSGIYNQPFKVASVMGLIFFIMNAAVSLILLIICLLLAFFTIFSKNPDARFSPTKDDRTSFQRKHNSIDENRNNDGNELFELGMVAKEHDDDWATNMYNLRDIDDGNLNNEEFKDKDKDSDDKLFDQEISSSSSNGLGTFVSKLTRGKSFLSRNKSKQLPNNELPTPEGFLSKSNIDITENSNDDLLDDSDKQNDSIQNPFGSSNDLKFDKNPFESTTPFHLRNESHATNVTNGTTGTTGTAAGLSVFGERIGSNYSLDEESDIESNASSGAFRRY